MLDFTPPSRLRRTAAVVAIAGIAAATPAYASQSVGTIDLELNVTNACVVNGATSVQSNVGSTGKILFADQPGTFTSVDGQLVGSVGALSVQCSPGASPTLTVGSGANDSNGSRYLASGASTVAYRLFTDSGRTNEIAIGQQLALGTATSSAISVPIYARAVNNGTMLPAGKYTDTVQVTLSW